MAWARQAASRSFLLFFLVVALATCGDARIFRQPVLGRLLPFPGRLRCVLRADLSSNEVLSSTLGGDAGANADLWIRLYWFQNQLNAHVHFNGHDLTGQLPPTNQSINLGFKGQNGPVVWKIEGTWTVQNPTQIELDRWIMGTRRTMVPGTSMTFQQLIHKIDKNPTKFYGTISTDSYPSGAVRGQFIRGFPNMLLPVPRCN
ncbi:unnamed protein product [Closterium sp. NIES-64]|nr:unnamed protein product [Closterium sp. NIES-64]